ncbi:hypothetical protein N39L_52090 [Limnospira platensis NIES-39]|uniref:Transposase n=1 Tax=Limnospira platensis NIES-46 TaxID=1236695 RepID=A0A5M3TDZ6_LIMPL|nr:hypothetical protein N39L_52090 [Arthrospira platensis NIES-39]GCE96655.1 hypothetical protein NIES46_47270 [Arthrospira platensis NIES-46]
MVVILGLVICIQDLPKNDFLSLGKELIFHISVDLKNKEVQFL